MVMNGNDDAENDENAVHGHPKHFKKADDFIVSEENKIHQIANVPLSETPGWILEKKSVALKCNLYKTAAQSSHRPR